MSLIEIGRNSVQTWECDAMDHMNVQFYVQRAAEGLASLAMELGVGPGYARSHDTALYPIDQHLRFLKEMRVGTPFAVYGGVLEADSQSVRVYSEIRHSITDAPSATFITDCAFVDRSTLKPKSLPSSALQRAEQLKTVLPSHAAPRGVTLGEARAAPSLAEADRLKMVRTFQSVVSPHDCDTHGFMEQRAYMGRVSDAIPNLLAQAMGRDRGQSTIGGAALEYRFVFRKAAQEGDILAVRSGLKSVANKTYNWVHWLFDLDTGDAVATAEAVAISLDLTTRKSIDIPPEMRAHLERLLVTGLSV